jgi:hypothetical protein
VMKNVFKRLFRQILKQIPVVLTVSRIYAHTYYSHAQEIVNLGVEAHLNSSFKHFYLFIKEFDLVDPAELAPLQDRIEVIMNQIKELGGN